MFFGVSFKDQGLISKEERSSKGIIQIQQSVHFLIQVSYVSMPCFENLWSFDDSF